MNAFDIGTQDGEMVNLFYSGKTWKISDGNGAILCGHHPNRRPKRSILFMKAVWKTLK